MASVGCISNQQYICFQVKHQKFHSMAVNFCSRKQIGSLTFNFHKSCFFSHTDIFRYIHSLKVPFICSLSRTSFCATVNRRASQIQVTKLTLLYNLANATYSTCKTVIATKILPLENYSMAFFFCNRKYPFLYTVLFCIHYLFRGILKKMFKCFSEMDSHRH